VPRFDQVVGQGHLLAEDGPLGRMVKAERVSSLILWGPPGTGKSELARLISATCQAPLYEIASEDADGDRLGWYTQPAWRIKAKWIAFYRYDFLDNGESKGDTIENVIGLNFLPKPNIRLRTTVTLKEFGDAPGFKSADAQIYQTSATLSF